MHSNLKQQKILTQRNKTILFLLFLMVFCILVYILTSGIESAVDPVSMLPRNTALMVDLKEPAGSIDRLRRSKLGRQVASIQWQEALSELGVPENDFQKLIQSFNQFEGAIESPLFRELFGKRVLLGVIPELPSGNSHIEKNNPVRMMVLIARPKHRASIVDFSSRFFASDFEYTEQPYRGRIIRTYVFNNSMSFSSSVTDGLVIASLSPKAVKSCIDISIENMTTGQSGLKDNNTYSLLKKRAGGSDDQFVYVNVKSLQSILNRIKETWDFHALGSAVHNNILFDELPVKYIAFFRQPHANLFRYTGVIQYNPDNVHFENTLLQKYQPEFDTVLTSLPDDILAHFWTNAFDAGEMWAFIQKGPNNFMHPYLLQLETWLFDNTELSVEEFLSLLGSQVSLNVTEIRSSGFFPMPRISLQVKVTDAEEVDHLLEKLFAGLHVRQSVVSNNKVYTVLLAGGLVQPSYTFSDGFLVIADSSTQLEKILLNDRKLLTGAPLFKKIDVGLSEKNNMVVYYKNAELVDVLKEMLMWYGTLLPFFDTHSVSKNKVVIDEIILPVLEGLKMYKVKSGRLYRTETEIIMKSALQLEGENR